MARFLTERYPQGTPEFIACAVSMGDQQAVDEKVSHLLRVNTTRVAALEPLLGPWIWTGFGVFVMKLWELA